MGLGVESGGGVGWRVGRGGVSIYIYIFVCSFVYIYLCVCSFVYIYICVCVVLLRRCVNTGPVNYAFMLRHRDLTKRFLETYMLKLEYKFNVNNWVNILLVWWPCTAVLGAVPSPTMAIATFNIGTEHIGYPISEPLFFMTNHFYSLHFLGAMEGQINALKIPYIFWKLFPFSQNTSALNLNVSIYYYYWIYRGQLTWSRIGLDQKHIFTNSQGVDQRSK